MENKMKEVAKLLGVELEEEFRIEGYTTKYKLTENGLKRWLDDCQQWCISLRLGELLTGEMKITKISKPILDDKEKEYLSNVIKPFRDRVSSISKDGSLEYITISLDSDDFAILPNFEEGTMYKGMEINRRYTLEELGL